MIKELNEWRMRIESALKNHEVDAALLIKHRARIDFFSQERLAHLHVTLAVGNFLLISAVAAVLTAMSAFYWIVAIFFVLFIFYIVHYFRLENGVQDMYGLYGRLEEEIDKDK